MAKVRMLRLLNEPVWLQSASIDASDKVQIASEGTQMHVRFLEGHPAHGRGISHVVFKDWHYAILEDEGPAVVEKRK